jgi:hypothetical protein
MTLPATGVQFSFGDVKEAFGGGARGPGQNISLSYYLGSQLTGLRAHTAQISFSSTFGGRP